MKRTFKMIFKSTLISFPVILIACGPSNEKKRGHFKDGRGTPLSQAAKNKPAPPSSVSSKNPSDKLSAQPTPDSPTPVTLQINDEKNSKIDGTLLQLNNGQEISFEDFPSGSYELSDVYFHAVSLDSKSPYQSLSHFQIELKNNKLNVENIIQDFIANASSHGRTIPIKENLQLPTLIEKNNSKNRAVEFSKNIDLSISIPSGEKVDVSGKDNSSSENNEASFLFSLFSSSNKNSQKVKEKENSEFIYKGKNKEQENVSASAIVPSAKEEELRLFIDIEKNDQITVNSFVIIYKKKKQSH